MFGEEGLCPPQIVCGPQFRGATPDLAHVVLNSVAPLLETKVSEGLYEWSAGRLALLSVLPKGKEGGGAVSGALGDRSGSDSRHAISSDGSRVVWMTNSVPHLYLRDGEETVRLDPELGGTPEVVFQGASADVSRVWFTDNGDLYEYDVGHGELHRLTEGAGVVGSLPGVSEDGSYVYFVANGKLTEGEGAVSGKCGKEFSTGSECNLYVLHDGVIGLVAVLSGEDNPDWSNLAGLTARVSPDGRFLAFMSGQRLTGYDNRDAVSGKLDEEVFLYHAPESLASEPGVLRCASCDPTGRARMAWNSAA